MKFIQVKILCDEIEFKMANSMKFCVFVKFVGIRRGDFEEWIILVRFWKVLMEAGLLGSCQVDNYVFFCENFCMLDVKTKLSHIPGLCLNEGYIDLECTVKERM